MPLSCMMMNDRLRKDFREIRFIEGSEWEEAMNLAYRTFLQFDAASYTEEGIENFRNFVSDHALKRMFDAGSYQVIGAFAGDGKLIGIISLRDNTHISLLFVDREYHRQGVGSALFHALADYVRVKLHQDFITVNAAPYALGFYHKLGFRDVSEALTRDGIIFTPMRYDTEDI